MLTVISPAKRLDLDTPPLPEGFAPTEPAFATDAARLARLARGLSVDELRGLMDISEDLARLNRDRFRAFVRSPAPEQTRPAALIFAGDTYAGLEARTMHPDALRWAQGHLRILSGLYGLLRPLDAIQPYRLEMGSRLANPKGETLYAFWGARLATALNAQAREVGATALINCASQEYFAAVDRKALRVSVITPVFLEEKAGEAKVISFFAKRARGAMARFIADHRLTDPQDIRAFDLGGYRFRPDLGTADSPVFLRAAAESEAA
jgi:cytoplasmic iron level regulating protein YaaA (DUF328/UPF0246 family)